MTGRRGAWRALRLLVVAGIGLSGVLSGVAVGQEAFFREGNQRYQDGDFAGALESYRRVLDDGVESGALLYNMGNAHFKQGDLGRAILFYERARRWLPGDEDLRANLELARSLTVDRITPLPGFWLFRAARWWVDLLPRTVLVWLVGLAYVLAVTAVTVIVLRPPRAGEPWARRAAIAATAVTLVFGVNLLVRELRIGEAPAGVVVAAETLVHSAPSDDADLALFAVHEGTTVRLDRRSDEWVEIRLADGRVGWIPADTIEEI